MFLIHTAHTKGFHFLQYPYKFHNSWKSDSKVLEVPDVPVSVGNDWSSPGHGGKGGGETDQLMTVDGKGCQAGSDTHAQLRKMINSSKVAIYIYKACQNEWQCMTVFHFISLYLENSCALTYVVR